MLKSSLSVLCLSATIVLGRPSSPGECQSAVSFAYEPSYDRSSVRAHVISNTLTRPRGIAFDESENLLVVDSGVGVVAFTQVFNDSSCTSGWEKRTVVQNADLNHGIAVVGNKLWASSSDALYEWNYTASEANVSGGPRTVVSGMSNDDHATRTLVYQPGDPPHMIISRGSQENIDAGASDISTGRSQLRRFNFTSSTTYDWLDGELLAWGMRNGVGIALSQDGSRLWEVENSADQIQYMSTDVHLNNPAEELNVVDLTNTSSWGRYYGYPSCYTVWDLDADHVTGSNLKTGDQFSIETSGEKLDAWCQNENNNVKPALSFKAHSAPLDIKFYGAPDNSQYALDDDWNHDAFVSFHGSWNTDPPTGYGVVRVPWDEEDNKPEKDSDEKDGYSFIIQAPDTTVCPQQCIRPVGLAFNSRGQLFISSDATKEIFFLQSPNAPGEPSGGLARTSFQGLFVALAITVAILPEMIF